MGPDLYHDTADMAASPLLHVALSYSQRIHPKTEKEIRKGTAPCYYLLTIQIIVQKTIHFIFIHCNNIHTTTGTTKILV